MSLSSLRALFLALALVVQTIAGGWGVAHAATPGVQKSVSAHCATKASLPGDAHHRGESHDCDSCCLSAGAPSLTIADVVSVWFAPRAFTAARFVPSDGIGAPARLTRSRFARGPPSSF